MDPQARKDLVFIVAFALGRCCIWLRDMIKPHNGDEARMQAAEAIVRQIEQSNFRVERVPPRPPHSTPGRRRMIESGCSWRYRVRQRSAQQSWCAAA